MDLPDKKLQIKTLKDFHKLSVSLKKIIMTGTPSAKPEDYWSQIYF